LNIPALRDILSTSENRPKASIFAVVRGAGLWHFPAKIERSGYMETKHDTKNNTEYQIGNTLYQVAPVFKNGETAEDLADKIKRLILNDKEHKILKP